MGSHMTDKNLENHITSRRKNPPKRRKILERRGDMKLIVSATQKDIYIWAISMALMVGTLATFIVLATVMGAE